ncbi:MAG TPA: DHA2 family efflux MFS transporter permease subunit [Ornithinibacter sp.]|nr:DHA2 family efflux MFS transporter permease subunit [Ornithinibacter sp.]HOB80836.1 DHA2 family efflux MFS transporter permease subunit [Ornithinibacter sp.]HQA13412.1 DHA2 family efflux MFS transporter permease subunit [Ornithinibacter sp.]HQD69230.1 DHA2 family efflux MFS transporter permease subunit [Ornithinibacter sp.]
MSSPSAPPAPPAHPGYPDKIDGAVLKVAGVVVLGAIMSILDITVVNVALPTFQADFASGGEPLPYSTVAWTVTAYTLALATVIPLTGWAADRFGTKRLYMTALLLFTAGSVLCAMASTIEALIAFRVIQGLGGGMLMPLGMTIMTKAAGPARMGRLMAILGVPMLLGPIFGPILGGWLIENYSWHWIFLINLPIGAAALVYAWRVLPSDRPEPSESFDWVGMALMSPGLALFLYGISSIPGEGTFFSSKVIIPGTLGLVMVAGFVVWSFRPAHPLLDLRLFKNRNLTVSTITMFLFAAAFFGGLLLVPTYFQQVRGESALSAGWLMAVQGLGAMITMPIAGSLVDKLPVGRIVPFGLAAIVGGMFALTQVTATTSYWYILPVLFVMGLGMGSTMMPLMTSALKTLTSHEVARGSTLLNISQQIASSIGVAIMSVVLTNGLNNDPLLKASRAFGEASNGVTDPGQLGTIAARFPEVAALLARGQEALMAAVDEAMASAFATTFWVAAILLSLTLIPAWFLPRKREVSHLLDDADAEQVAPPIVLH